MNRAVVLGNGPSLKNFDFDRLHGIETFGMNVAYRYWDQINWYPSFYSCLDLVVGLHHKEEIRRLINSSSVNGIKGFLLRENLIDELGDLEYPALVTNFDVLQSSSGVMAYPMVSTGSHTTSWAAYLGFREIFLLGVDVNYTEVVEGAKLLEGTILEIVDEQEENPNYFFKGYQLPGDKYNIPNPVKNVHLLSWQGIQASLPKGVVVLNANLHSKLNVFDFCDFAQLESGGEISVIFRSTIFKADRNNQSDETINLGGTGDSLLVTSEPIRRPFYARRAEKLRKRVPALFRVGQLGMRGLRFLKRLLESI